MKENFITYNQALALKELGCDEPCLAAYIDKTLKGCGAILLDVDGYYINSKNETDYVVAAPLKSQVFKWFRDKYNIYGMVTYYGKKQWFIEILDHKGNDLIKIEHNTFWSCEEAESACIDKLIEIIKEKKS